MKPVIVATLIVCVVASIAGVANGISLLKYKQHHRPSILKQDSFMKPSEAVGNPSCVPTIATIAIDLASVIHDVTTAVGMCKKEKNPADCAVDVTNVVEAVSSLADEINQAVISCDGVNDRCSNDILTAVHHLSEVADDIAKAVPHCQSAIEGQCSSLINIAMEKLSNVVEDIKKSISDCSHVSAKAFAGKVVVNSPTINGDPQNPSCASSIGTASVDIAQVIGAIYTTVKDCSKLSNTLQCADDGAKSANEIAILSDDLEKAVEACGGHKSVCAEDIVSAAETITQMADYVLNAIPLCKKSIEGECSRIIYEAGKEIGNVIGTIKHAIRDCVKV